MKFTMLAHIASVSALAMVTVLMGVSVETLARNGKLSTCHPARKPMVVTVADTIATHRLLGRADDSSEGAGVLLSPDGRRYAFVVARGDLAKDLVNVQLYVGGTATLDAARPKIVAELSTSSKEFHPTHVVDYKLVWAPDSNSLLLLWSDGEAPSQIVRIDAGGGKVTTLTQHPSGIVGFDTSKTGDIVFSALKPRPDIDRDAILKRGFAVQNQDAFSFLAGEFDGYIKWAHIETYVLPCCGGPARRVVLNGVSDDRFMRRPVQFSPDGTRALVEGTPASIPDSWRAIRDPYIVAGIQKFPHSEIYNNELRQLFLVDSTHATARPLWSAPVSGFGTYAWSPEGRSVVISGTFLPDAVQLRVEQGGGVLSQGVLIQVDVETGKATPILNPFTAVDDGVAGIEWSSAADLILTSRQGKRVVMSKDTGDWQPAGDAKRNEPGKAAGPLRILVEEGLNQTPRVVAVDQRNGKRRVLLRINGDQPGLDALCNVEPYKWSDRRGGKWEGVLYRPIGYVPGRRFPLVVQISRVSLEAYSTLGYEASTSGFAAQPLAARGIMVLQMADPNRVHPAVLGSKDERAYAMDGIESALRQLDRQGLIDLKKVGLVGFSRTGSYVLYTLSHTKMAIAAAFTGDNASASYVEYTLGDIFWQEFERSNGGVPSGDGLKEWAERAPGFSPDKFYAPLRIQVDSGGVPYVLTQWELFTRLRRLNRPVELYVTPDIEHGVHGMVRPSQQLSSRQGNVDWFDFWLNDHEDPNERKDEQYARWRKLRELQPNN